jgi:hypothetical protein
LAKSRVDITERQHENVGKFLSLCFFVLYYISTLVEIGKTRNCVKTLRPSGVVFPHNFSFSQFPLVLIFNNYSPKARWLSGNIRRDEGWNYTIPDWFSYQINFHSEVKNKGVYTMHAASLCCQLVSRCRHGNK